MLYFTARRLRNWSEAEDAAQETIRRAIEAMQKGRIQKPESLPAFLFQTAVHVCQHRGRAAGREGRALRRFGAAPAEDASSDPLSSLILRSVELPSEWRSSGWIRTTARFRADVLGRPPSAEIAKRLSLTEGNVRVRRHRALKRLGELLGVTSRRDREP